MSSVNKITNSHLYSWALNLVQSGVTRDRLFLEFRNKGFPCSKKIITQFMREVKGTEVKPKLSKIEEKTITIVDKLKKDVQDQNLNKVIGILERRGPILREVDNRIKILKDAQTRDNLIRKISLEIQIILNKVTEEQLTDEPQELRARIRQLEEGLRGIGKELTLALPRMGVRADLESVLQRYLKDKHDYYKYLEDFIAKYEIKTLLEKTAKAVATAAVEVMLNEIPEDKRVNLLKKFKESTLAAVRDISKEELDT